MDAKGLAAFTSTANMVRCKSAVDPMWARVDLHMIIEALHIELSELALPQKQSEISDVHFWLNLTKRAAQILKIPYGIRYQRNRALPGRFLTGNCCDIAPPAQILDKKPLKSTTKQAVTTNNASGKDDERSDTSDAVSDTSFTPPKNLGKCVKFDEDGRRHVVPSPRVAPKQRFVQEGKNGQRNLLPPPGFNNLAPKIINEVEPEPEKLTFERRQDFKKPSVKYGGISLAVMREQPERFEKLKNRRSSKKHKSAPKKHGRSKSQPMISVTVDGKTTCWQSWFLKGVFDAEEDLLYNTRWPASSF
ncbi:hypothetical protein F5X98DRAFT_367757 [Xylaria grammica]|nr:hypothetical protein F5X98DRAFT_367757 [Xylaria grammica]